jgi:hypothetical protein
MLGVISLSVLKKKVMKGLTVKNHALIYILKQPTTVSDTFGDRKTKNLSTSCMQSGYSLIFVIKSIPMLDPKPPVQHQESSILGNLKTQHISSYPYFLKS